MDGSDGSNTKTFTQYQSLGLANCHTCIFVNGHIQYIVMGTVILYMSFCDWTYTSMVIFRNRWQSMYSDVRFEDRLKQTHTHIFTVCVKADLTHRDSATSREIPPMMLLGTHENGNGSS